MTMRILHWDANFMCGGAVTNSVLRLATSQARLGAEVAIAAATSARVPMYGRLALPDDLALIEWRPCWAIRVHGSVLRGIPHDALVTLRAFKPDLVHVHGGFNPDNVWVPRLFDCPTVFSPHGSYHRTVLRKGRQAGKRFYLFLEKQLLHHRIAAFHALSPIERESIVRLIPDRRVYCLPQGPGNPAVLASGNDRWRHGEAVRFACLGRLDVFTKGLDALVEAFAQAARELPAQPISLTLAGPDWKGGMALLARRAAVLGIAERITFTGPLSGDAAASMLRGTHIYIQLSRHDAFSLSACEALVARKPAILSAAVGSASYPEIGGLPHVRVVRVRVQEAAAAMTEFVRQLPSLADAAARSEDVVRTFFSWERIAREQLATYKELRSTAREDPRTQIR